MREGLDHGGRGLRCKSPAGAVGAQVPRLQTLSLPRASQQVARLFIVGGEGATTFPSLPGGLLPPRNHRSPIVDEHCRSERTLVCPPRCHMVQQAAVVYSSSAGMKGRGNGRSPRKPADQRHRPVRFPHAKIRSDPAGDWTRITLVGGEQANRSATVASVFVSLRFE
ncbi:hypothetical protein PR048_016705 [Dryococelus australis]|uniref:Uncharacterized protein n=1 Tax=Dryococelus australis TaxID=614101 RepID=A0ABQ9H7G3_9NEOP|nr:hypothetical protein PR048_016705 [Dryococelus australis]